MEPPVEYGAQPEEEMIAEINLNMEPPIDHGIGKCTLLLVLGRATMFLTHDNVNAFLGGFDLNLEAPHVGFDLNFEAPHVGYDLNLEPVEDDNAVQGGIEMNMQPPVLVAANDNIVQGRR